MDLASGAAGPFGPGKFSTRVIDPIDIVARTPLGTTTVNGTLASSRSLTRNKVYIVDFRYAPTVNLATGAPKGGSAVKGVSAVGEDDIVTTSVIFKLPEGSEPAHINAVIALTENPAGGYFVNLTADLNVPGDDPDTPGISEAAFEQTEHTRLEYATGLVQRDIDGDGSFDDNPAVGDLNRDCLGDNECERFGDHDEHERLESDEISITAQIGSIDIAAGTISVTGAATNQEEGKAPYTGDPDVTLPFTEITSFVERSDQFPEHDGVPVSPTSFVSGQDVEIDLYPIKDDDGNILRYWVEKVKRDIRNGGGGGGDG
jgi:hypothetical protein